MLISCVTKSEKKIEYSHSYLILSMPNSFADIKWYLKADFTMQFYIKIMENDQVYEFNGKWEYVKDKIFVTFFSESINLSAIFDWNKKNENNIMIETDRIISFNNSIKNTNIYGVRCYFTDN